MTFDPNCILIDENSTKGQQSYEKEIIGKLTIKHKGQYVL